MITQCRREIRKEEIDLISLKEIMKFSWNQLYEVVVRETGRIMRNKTQ